RPALYEYRPLAKAFVEMRAGRLERLEDARLAVEELKERPEAAIFARGHDAGADGSLFRTVLLPLLVRTAEACGGFDWDDDAFRRAYCEFEETLFARRHSYVALAPLVGVSAGGTIELGPGLRLRMAAAGELAAHWPEAGGLLPADFGREADRAFVLELERPLRAGAPEPPDAPGELADALTAIRLATAGAVATGPVIFERLDWRPYGIRPAVPIAATQPPGEPTRLDPLRGRLAADLLVRLSVCDDDSELGEALDRFELSLFQAEPFRSEQLRESLTALLGGIDGLFAAALRASILLGDTGRDRAGHLRRLRALTAGEPATTETADAVRLALVEALLHGDRVALIASLDDSLVGLSPRPTGYRAARSLAS
nr:hypothetical protein [Actinomycetota bacterium]